MIEDDEEVMGVPYRIAGGKSLYGVVGYNFLIDASVRLYSENGADTLIIWGRKFSREMETY